MTDPHTELVTPHKLLELTPFVSRSLLPRETRAGLTARSSTQC